MLIQTKVVKSINTFRIPHVYSNKISVDYTLESTKAVKKKTKKNMAAQMKRSSAGPQHVAVTAFSPASNQPPDWRQKHEAQHERRPGQLPSNLSLLSKRYPRVILGRQSRMLVKNKDCSSAIFCQLGRCRGKGKRFLKDASEWWQQKEHLVKHLKDWHPELFIEGEAMLRQYNYFPTEVIFLQSCALGGKCECWGNLMLLCSRLQVA